MSQTVCPEEIRAQVHKDALQEIWASPEWTAACDAYLKTNPVCSWCGKKASLPHHIDPDDYKDKAKYIDFTRSKVIPLCHRCHEELRKGRRVCPKCRKHYIPLNDYQCKYCMPPAERLKLRAEQSAARKSRKEWKEIRNEINRKNAKAAYQGQKAWLKAKQEEGDA